MRTGELRSATLRLLGPCLVVIGALLAPLGVVLSYGHDVLTEEGSFVETFTPLADDPQVRARVADLVLAEIDVPGLAERLLEEAGVPSWLTDLLEPWAGDASAAMESVDDLIVEGIEDRVREALRSLMNSEEFSIVWQETLRASHGQIVEQLRSPSRIPLQLDVQPVIAAARDALIAEGATFARFIPDLLPKDSVVLLPAGQMEPIAPLASLIVRFGSWFTWACLALFVAGIVISRRRLTWLLIGGGLLAVSAFGARLVTTSGHEWSIADPIASAAAEALVDVTFRRAGPTLLEITAIGAATAGVTFGIILLRRQRGALADRS